MSGAIPYQPRHDPLTLPNAVGSISGPSPSWSYQQMPSCAYLRHSKLPELTPANLAYGLFQPRWSYRVINHIPTTHETLTLAVATLLLVRQGVFWGARAEHGKRDSR